MSYLDSYKKFRLTESTNTGMIHIGTDIKTDSDIFYEPRTGAFYINVIDAAGNRTNKLQVNTIDDVLTKFKNNWKWTEQGEAEFPDFIDEISTSGDAGAYSTPYAFSDTDEPEGDYIEMLGYKKVKKNENQNESAFVKISKELHINEIAYNMYRNDPSYSPKQKVNKSIAEINKKLNEIQKIINQNVKLKEEMGVSNQDFWKSTNDNLSIMGSKMLNIAKKLKELSL